MTFHPRAVPQLSATETKRCDLYMYLARFSLERQCLERCFKKEKMSLLMPMIDCVLIQQLTGTLKASNFLCYPPSLQVKGNDGYSIYISDFFMIFFPM